MSNWFNNLISAAEDAQDGLSPKRRQSLQLLKKTPWPTRKSELWKYTSLKALDALELPKIAANASTHAGDIAGLDTLDIVFVDGKLQSIPEQNVASGLVIVPLGDAQHQPTENQLFSSIKPNRHFFGLVNDVLASEGLIIEVEAGTVIEKPIRVISIVSAGVETHVRLLVKLAEGASLTVIEQPEGNGASVNTFFSEYEIGANAKLNHYRFATQSNEAIALSGNHFRLADHAKLASNIIAFGSALSRLDVDIVHAGERSQATLNGIYLLDHKELFDLHTTVEHTAPHGQTEENIRGIVGGEARAVFNGRIHIHRYAQKTEATLNNRNLLLSNKAEIDTKPELEIYADDVRCAHGATVSQVDDSSLYYMQSRGIGREQAKAMLNFGFINELLDQLPHPDISEWLRPQIRERFNRSMNGQSSMKEAVEQESL